MSAVRHRAGRRQLYAECHSTHEHGVKGRKSSSPVVAKMIDTKRKVGEKQTDTASLGIRACITGRREIQGKIVALLSEQPLAEQPSFLEVICKGDGVVADGLYSIFTFQPFQKPPFKSVKTSVAVPRSVIVFWGDINSACGLG